MSEQKNDGDPIRWGDWRAAQHMQFLELLRLAKERAELDEKHPKVTVLRDHSPLPSLLQDELLAVIDQDRFDNLTVATIIGILEFMKWNLINRSD
jgi:hypothetical protein